MQGLGVLVAERQRAVEVRLGRRKFADLVEGPGRERLCGRIVASLVCKLGCDADGGVMHAPSG